MKKYYRIIAVLCLFVLLLQTVACEKTPSEGGQTTDSSAVTPLPETGEAVLVRDGKLTVGIVRSEEAGVAEKDMAVELRKTLLALYPDAAIQIREEYLAKEEDEKDNVEILIGELDRQHSKAVYADLPYGNGVLKVIGNKIVVAAWADVAYSSLNTKLTALIQGAADKNNVTLTDKDNLSVTVNQSINTLPVVAGIYPSQIVSAGDKAYQVYFSNATAENLAAYLEKLQAAGYTCLMDRNVGENRYTSYTGNGNSVTAYFTAANKAMRVIVEPESNLYKANNSGETKTTPMLTMIGRHFSNTSTYLGYDAGNGLMCFMLRLSDGRFIVIDGGNQDNSISSYAMALYAKMREQAPDPNNIVIAAWFFTHTHGDHTGGFRSFCKTYSGVVKLESIIMNFPTEADHKAYSDETDDWYTGFYSHAKTYFPSTPIYKMHTGQQYQIADAQVEILYTQEDFITKTQTTANVNNNWNNTSAIFSVSIAGQKIMFLGDAQNYANDLTAKIYGNYLKSDFVQVAHHGGIGGTKAIYQAVDADVALFTTGDVLLPVYIDKWDYNFYLVNSLHLKDYFNSHDRITTFALPYTPKGNGFMTTTKN